MTEPIDYVDPYAVTKKIETIKRSIPASELYARERERLEHFLSQAEIARAQLAALEPQLEAA
jgi:hypothetical protein